MFVTNSTCHYNHENANSFEIIENRDPSGWHGKLVCAVRPTFLKTNYEYLGL